MRNEKYVYVCRVCKAAFKADDCGLPVIVPSAIQPFYRITKEEFLARRLRGHEELDILCSDECCEKE
jgi:argonaute-like protein implicated in RNA metabolism and viral defense